MAEMSLAITFGALMMIKELKAACGREQSAASGYRPR